MKSIFRLFKKNKVLEEITIVSGLPRSGTSLMMKMLEAGGLPIMSDNMRKADNDNPKGYYELERVKELYKGDVDWLKDAEGKVVKVISGLLSYLSPAYNYQIIFMRRNMAEILASQKKMLIHRREEDNISDEEMTKKFEEHIKQIERWMLKQRNMRYININYNALLENPDAHIASMNEFLSNKLDIEKMISVIDPNLYRQRYN